MKLYPSFLLIVSLAIISCIQEPEFKIPPIFTNEQFENATSDLATAINRFKQADVPVYTFDSDTDIRVNAFVVSSDEAGNFYKTMIVQDQPNQPNTGLEIKIDLRSYYLKYNFGRKILLRLSGLSIENINGKYVIGYLDGNRVGDIPESLLDHFIIRSSETVEIIPTKLSLENVSTELMNTYVELDKIQFSKSELGKSFSSELIDKYNGERSFVQCQNSSTGVLSTSTYADFSNHLLPAERFRFQALITKDSYSGDIVFVLIHPNHIWIVDQDRCDPFYFECSFEYAGSKEQEIYYENFESLGSSRDIEKIGWENLNLNYGIGRFKKRSRNDNTFLQVSAYDSKEFVMDVWLISPSIELDNSEHEFLTFDTRATFAEGSLLTCWFSADYNGEVSDAIWKQLDVEISVGSHDGSNDLFLTSGKINLHCVEGKIRLAFRYLGSDPGSTTTYDLDNVLILGKQLIN